MAEATAEKPKVTKPAAKPAASVKSGKKAVISTGGHQYLVTEGQTLEVELLDPNQQNTAFEALMVIDGDSISVGAPTVSGVKVAADIVEQSVKGDKVVAIRYKAKKRVRKVRGHRQRHTVIKITKIGVRG
jgi:large subunit ribosomal protein L21